MRMTDWESWMCGFPLYDSTQIDVEIQPAEFAEWADRSLFYLAKMFTGQITKGQGYNQLKNVSVSAYWILSFLKGQMTFIPVSISVHTAGILFTRTKWDSM